MHIDLDDAIQIHARVSRARFGRGAKKRALSTAQKLRQAGDQGGAAVWERLATEIDRAGTRAKAVSDRKAFDASPGDARPLLNPYALPS
jgi:hypothetical protein